MATYFQQVSVSYVNVPIINTSEVETDKFLEATEGVIKLFDILNSTAFGPVKSDMQGNVNKIRAKFMENPALGQTLQGIVNSEKGLKKKTATEGLLWLRRALEFTAAALRRNINDANEELSVSFNKAYEVTLSKHHSFMVKPIFHLAMKACPYRKDFYLKLGSDGALVLKEMELWLAALEKILAVLAQFYIDGAHG